MFSLVRSALQLLSRDKLSVFLFHKVPTQSDPLAPHDISLKEFEYLLDTVFSGFQIISLEEGVRGLISGSLPRRAACITFDDGYADWLTGVAPALKRRGLPATLFITAGQFEGRPLWHERIALAVREMQGTVLDLKFPAIPPLAIATVAERAQAVAQLERSLKYLTLAQREELLESLESQAQVRPQDVTCLSIEQLRTLGAQGFTIGAHTYEHPILDYCDERQAVREIGETREILEGVMGEPVRMFAYPNGRPYVDFASHHVAIVKSAGYASAVTTQWGVAEVGSSVYQIPRFTPWGKDPLRIMLQLSRNLMTEPERVPEH